jgi:signal transduction histidine kinase
VILNLIVNGIEAMSGVSPQQREMLVASSKDHANGVLITVRDSGSGLDTTSPERLFAPFYTTKTDGMGMGLAISRTIIETHGGELWAAPSDSRGAVLRFRLPADSEHAS